MKEEKIEMRASLPPKLDEVPLMSDKEIVDFRDDRDYKLQHLVAEKGNLCAVRELMRRGFEFEEKIGGQAPVDLALSNQHFDVVLNLLEANSRFPCDLCNKPASDDLNAFVRLSSELHDCIKNEEVEKLQEIVARHSHLKYFYNTENKSAARVALEARKFNFYEILLTNHVCMGPHEDSNEIFKTLSANERRELRELHTKLSSSVLAEPLATFMQNSHFGPDCPDQAKYRHFVQDAYLYLLQIPRLLIILNVVAASKFFKIVFDFKREFVDFLDPTSEPYTNGLFYLSGRMYIGAKGMLDPTRFNEVVSVIAHELCHYAMFLVYGNFSRPYKVKDKVKKREFEGIVDDCRKNSHFESLVHLVFSAYPLSMQHAELIVRVPHMMVLYHENPKVLDLKRKTYPKLFNKFDNSCLPDMEKAIPKIKRRFRSEYEKKVEKQRRTIAWISILSIILLAVSGCAAYWLHIQNYSWEKLKYEDKVKVNDTIVQYLGSDVKFGELFPETSPAHDLLTPKAINGALNGDGRELSKAIEGGLDTHINLKWATTPESLKVKFMNSNVTFQGESMKINKILEKSSTALEYLESSQIKQILGQKPFNISSKLDPKTNFMFERDFRVRNLNADYADFEEIKADYYNEGFYDSKDFSDIINEIKDSRLVFLSSLAGEGKSTTFQNFWFKFKALFPSKWVQFIDLKKYLKVFKEANKTDFSNRQNLLRFLSKDLLDLPDFESQVFTERFDKGEVIFFWDGADEIFPLYEEFMLNLVEKIEKSFGPWQFISTRPHSMKSFRKKQENKDLRPFHLSPLTKPKRFEFLVKFVVSKANQNLDVDEFCTVLCDFLYTSSNLTSSGSTLSDLREVNDVKIANYLKKVKNIDEIIKLISRSREVLTSIENINEKSKLITNPLLIKMAADFGTGNETLNTKKISFYTLYESFIDKMIQIAMKKDKIVVEDIGEVFKHYSINVMKAHEPFALKLIFSSFLTSNFSHLFDKEFKKVTDHFKKEVISRFGILTVHPNDNRDTDFIYDFVHRTFAEFFVAQYFINNADEFLEFESHDSELKTYLLYSILFSGQFSMVHKFIVDFALSNDESPHKFIKQINHQLQIAKDLENVTSNEKILNFLNFFEFSEFVESLGGKSVKFDNAWFFPWKTSEYEEFITNWGHFGNFYDNKMLKKVLNTENSNGENFLNQFLRDTKETRDEALLEQLIAIYQEILNETDTSTRRHDLNDHLLRQKVKSFRRIDHKDHSIGQNDNIPRRINLTDQLLEQNDNIPNKIDLSRHFYNENRSKNLLIHASQYQNHKVLSLLWNSTVENFTDKEKQKILKDRSLKLNFLELTVLNDDEKSFLFMKDIYKKYLSPQELQEILTNYDSPSISNSLKNQNDKISREYSNLLLDTFKENLPPLQKLLKHRDMEGESIFMKFKNSRNLKVFEELLQQTFVNKSEFQPQLQKLQARQIIEGFFDDFMRQTEDFEVVHKYPWNYDDYEYFIDHWEGILSFLGSDKFRKIHNHTVPNYQDLRRTTLHLLLRLPESEKLISRFLLKLNATYHKGNEISSYLLMKAMASFEDKTSTRQAPSINKLRDFGTPLTIAAGFSNLKAIEILWEFSKEILSPEELKKVLNEKNNFYNAVRNKNEGVCQFVEEIIRNNLDQSDIEQIFKRPSRQKTAETCRN